jgi:hypothetical protein
MQSRSAEGIIEQMAYNPNYNPQQNGYYAAPAPNGYVLHLDQTKIES